MQDVKKQIKDSHKRLEQLTRQDLQMLSYSEGLGEAIHDIEHLAEQIQVISGIWHSVSMVFASVLFKVD